MNSFIKDLKLLSEDYRIDDIFGFDVFAEKLHNKVAGTPDVAIIGIVGRYGIGKSVMLETYKKMYTKNVKWVHIDAWKYPERKNLWEGFILDFAAQIDKKTFNSAKQRLDGDGGAKQTAVKAVGGLTNILLPGSGNAVEKLAYFVRTSPAKRIYEVQEILNLLIKRTHEKDIYIIIEDADRSGDAGIYFIETLNQYLKNIELDHTVKVFVPISNIAYEDPTKHESFIKCLDFIEKFSPESLSMNDFIESIFTKEVVGNAVMKSNIDTWLSHCMRHEEFTIRKLKLMLRNSTASFSAQLKDGFKPDPRITIMMESAKFLKPNSSLSGVVRDHMHRDEMTNLTHASPVFVNLLLAIGMNIEYRNVEEKFRTNEIHTSLRIFSVKDGSHLSAETNTAIPSPNPRQGGRYSLPEFYLNY